MKQIIIIIIIIISIIIIIIKSEEGLPPHPLSKKEVLETQQEQSMNGINNSS